MAGMERQKLEELGSMAIHVRNLEKYNPGYKDRRMYWCKFYFSAVSADPDFEMLDEIDKWRYFCLVSVELQVRKPIPTDEKYWKGKGFNLKRRPLLTTIHALLEAQLIELQQPSVTENAIAPEVSLHNPVTQRREEKRRKEKSRLIVGESADHKKLIEYFYQKYQDKIGGKYAFSWGKDGATVKRLLSAFGLELAMQIVDQFFRTSDEFVQKAGYSIGVLASQANKMVQEIKGVTKGQKNVGHTSGKDYGPTGEIDL